MRSDRFAYVEITISFAATMPGASPAANVPIAVCFIKFLLVDILKNDLRVIFFYIKVPGLAARNTLT